MKITVDKALIEQALEAHCAMRDWIKAAPEPTIPMPGTDGDWLDDVEGVLAQALAEPAVEPCGYASIEGLRQLQYCNGMSVWCESPSMWGPKEQAPPAPPNLIAIYTAPPPPAEVPLLTDDEIDNIFSDTVDKFESGEVAYESVGFARAIEAAVHRKAGLK